MYCIALVFALTEGVFVSIRFFNSGERNGIRRIKYICCLGILLLIVAAALCWIILVAASN
jgi:hypothetical protein